jgi:putative SOS response-associated peptidase YedK
VCGRFTLTTPAELVAEAFGLDEVPELSPRRNISPTEDIAAVTLVEGRRVLRLLKWGFPAGTSRPIINARAETIASRPAFRDAFRLRRCLVPADGFYEWVEEGGKKKALWFRRPDRAPFAFAGLFEEAHVGPFCTLVTTTPTRVVAPIHDRMPVILPKEEYARWLDPKIVEPRILAPLLAPREGFPLDVGPAGPLGRDVA